MDIEEEEFNKWISILADTNYIKKFEDDYIELTDKFREELAKAIYIIYEKEKQGEEIIYRDDTVIGILAIRVLNDAKINKIKRQEMENLISIIKSLIATFYEPNAIEKVFTKLEKSEK